MASYVPCKKNDTNGCIFYVSLVSQADVKLFQANPTLAAGDVKRAIDDAAPANLGTLPAVDGDFTDRVKVTLSQAETNGDNITIIFSDAAGAEWCDLCINIQTAAQTLDEMDTNIDDIETDTNEIQSKLPTNKFMGSSDGADEDGTLNTIAGDVVNLDGSAMRGTDNVVLAGPTKGEMDTAHALLATPAQVATELGNYDAPTKGEMDTAHALLATPAQVASELGTYDAPTKGELDTAEAAIIAEVDANEGKIDALPDAAAINAEVLDVHNTDTLSELGVGAPAATPTLRQAMMLLYMALRDKVDIDGSWKEIHNDAGTVVAKKALTDNGTTYSEAKAQSG